MKCRWITVGSVLVAVNLIGGAQAHARGLFGSGFLGMGGSTTTAWDRANDPSILSRSLVMTLNGLPLKGWVPQDQMPWADTYWPNSRGGIALRWNAFKWENPKTTRPDPRIHMIRSP